MPRVCSVLGCSNNGARNRVSFHRFPSILNHGKLVDPLAVERRRKWIQALQRSDITESKLKYGYVCSEHFVSGAPAHLKDKDNIDWIPTLKMGAFEVEEKQTVNNFDSTCESESSHDLVNDENNSVINHLCRLCLKELPEMWSFFSILTFQDYTTLDVAKVFQKITQQTNVEINNPKLPKYICEECVNLIVNANAFWTIYEKSISILNNIVEREKEGNNTVNTSSQPTKINNHIDDGYMSIGEQGMLVVDEMINMSNHLENAPKMHSCPICLEKFPALALKEHCQNHKSLKSYFKVAPKFIKKIRFYAQPRKSSYLFDQTTIEHSCPYCHQEFTANKFKEHVKQHRIEGDFRCTICNRVFMRKNHLKMHQLKHTKEAPFSCLVCKKGFFLQKNYNYHMLTHTTPNDLPFKCKYCEKTFSNPEHLKRHLFNHEKPVSYMHYYGNSKRYISCKKCLQKFKSKSGFEQHNCKLCCAKCHTLFDSTTTFKAHVCQKKLKPHQCKTCKKVFHLESSFKMHKSQCVPRRTLCYICGKNVSNMTQHLLTHYPNRKKIYPCQQCGKTFRHYMGVYRHIRQVHENVVAFWCQYCGKGFKSKWNLAVHERIHLGVKKHVCHVCKKEFLEKSYLKRHMRMHLNETELTEDDALKIDVEQ